MTKIKHYSLALIITAAIIIEAIGAVQYYMARRSATQEVLAKAARDIKESQRVASVKSEVETVINNTEQSIREALATPDTCYRISARIIKVNPHIVGVGVAFIPNYHKGKGRDGLFLPYTFDDQMSLSTKGRRIGMPHINTKIADFDYTQSQWFKSAMDGKRQWSDAYVSESGMGILLCTYSVPIKDFNGRTVAVFLADVTMEDATVLLNNMHSGFRKSAIFTFVIQIISFLLMGFIIWRAVQASRRYKEEMVDPEKENLIEQVQKLREVNGRLTKRNQELAEKVAELQRRIAAGSQQSDQHWFG